MERITPLLLYYHFSRPLSSLTPKEDIESRRNLFDEAIAAINIKATVFGGLEMTDYIDLTDTDREFTKNHLIAGSDNLQNGYTNNPKNRQNTFVKRFG